MKQPLRELDGAHADPGVCNRSQIAVALEPHPEVKNLPIAVAHHSSRLYLTTDACHDADVSQRNPATTALIATGIVFVAVGVILAVVMNGRAGADSFGADFAQALGVGDGGKQVSTDYGWMWGGVIIAALGALSLIAGLAVMGVTRKDAPPHQ